MYKLLMDDNHQTVFVYRDRSSKRFNGEYEGNILCKECDSGVIGKYEYYFAKEVYGDQKSHKWTREETHDGRLVVIREDDPAYKYDHYKLFLLSILWRASISSRPFFSQLKLPDEVEEELRVKVLSGDPGDPHTYPCFITLPPIATDPMGRRGFHTAYMPTMSPTYIEDGDLKIAEFIIQGVRHYFLIQTPENMKVDPGVQLNKVSMAFATLEEQSELIERIARYIESHRSLKN